ncbi:MAG TPA: hypothetical protein DC047_03825 [Blastocatellia bacterium]|nr:hypothetical protein [Blastocatellia bacterium]
MKNHPAQFGASAFVLLALAATTGTTVNAQGANQNAPPAQQQVTMRESELSTRPESAAPKRDPQEIMAEVNDDLHQLQTLTGSISTHAAATDQPLNYQSILADVTEIKKRSVRLRTDLALPQGGKDEKRDSFKDAEKGELQPALAALNKLLDSFLHNPIFSDAGAVDVQLAGKARRDLEDIVVLSDKVRKNAEKRSKLSGKLQ